MGKETREKTRNQRNSAPYNASNSSFAKRFTSKLGEYIPSNWATGWFDNTNNEGDGTTSENPNSIQVAVEINHFENATSSSKRTSLPNNNKLASNSNNRTIYTSKSNALGNETCSPILNSDRHPRDYQSAGPSGYSQPNKPTHNLFVASTPAFNVNKPPNGENGSESGESTSGCSSLVSQSNKIRTGADMGKSKSLFPNRQIPTEDITKSHNKSTGPQFDTSLFNSSSPSLNKSVNLSPFYPGRTMYGGASTYRKYSIGSNKSTTSPSIFQPSLRRASQCNQSKVNPSPTTLPKMSVVAENILKTINAMTPVTRLMTMPTPEEVNNSPASLRGTGLGNGVKRKLKELQIPTVVNTNLIQLKGSERKNALSQSIQEALSSCSSSSDEELDYSIVSNNAKRSLKEKMKRLRRGKSRNEEVQTEVNLPNVVLDVPSLPVIDIHLAKPSLDDVSFSEPIECQNFNISSESSLLSVSSNQDSDVNVNNSSLNFVYNSESSKPKPRKSITLSPVEAKPQPNIVTPNKEPPKLGKTWDCDICLNKFNPSESVCKACGMPQNTNNKLDSITNVTKPSSSLVEKFKPSSDTWECNACCVRNKADAVACVCCTTPKPGAKTSAPTPTPISTTTSSSTGGFGDLFKKPSGNWECPACMISNKSTEEKCVACETAKPGTKPAAKPASSNIMSGPKFPFATSSDSTTSFKFGVDKVDAKSPTPEVAKPPVTTSAAAAPAFSFGIPPASTAQSATLPAFSFGMPKAQDTGTEKKDSSVALTSVSNSIINSTSNSTVISPTSTSTSTLSTSSTFMFKSNSSLSTAADIKTPAAALSSPVVTVAAEVKTNTISTPSFSFGSTNGPIVKPETTVLSPKTVEVKPDVKESPTPKMSLFGATPSFLTNNTSDAQKPLGSLFGQTTIVNNSEPNKALNSFDAKKVQFNLAPTSNGEQPPSKMIDFGKPATASEPPKASIFGAAVFDKPKENSIFPSSNSNAAPPPAFPSKPEANVFAFGSTSKPVNNAFSAAAPSSAPVFTFGSATSTPQPPQAAASTQPGLSFASPTPAPAFSFNATATNSNFNSVPQPAPPAQQPVPLFGGGNSMFGNTAAPATAAPMFSAGFNPPTNPSPSPAPFTFGAPAPSNNASAGFSFGAQNTAPAPSAGFSFGAPSAAPPAFDPKMRPSFNFTSGAAPTFNAQPGLTASSSIGARRIKKAVRRK